MANKLISSAQYKKDRDALSEDLRFEVGALENELRYDRVSTGRKEETLRFQTKEPIHAYRIGREHRLLTCRWKSGEIILLLVDKHDDAYRRAGRLSLDWKSGETVFPTIVETEEVVIPVVRRKVPVMRKPFADFNAGDLEKIGVPKAQIPQLQALESVGGVGALFGENTEHAIALGSDLLDLAEGVATVGQILQRRAVERKRPPAETVLKTHPELREQYFVLTEENREAFLNGELEDWQVFLHPSQTRAVEIAAAGPVMVSGAAGTGKSVVALHRVRWLLRQKTFAGKRILFTTYTRTLAQYAAAMLATLCTPEEMERVDVQTFDTFLSDAWKQGGVLSARILKPIDNNPYPLPTPFEESLEEIYGPRRQYWHDRDRAFLRREYLAVILENDIRTLEDYKKLQRPRAYGRLGAGMRELFWELFAKWNESLSKFSRNKYRPKVAALNALTAALLAPDPNGDKDYLRGRYGAVVVDEVQDFGASEYRFLAALTGNSIEHPRPTLFLVGDGHQRVYGRSGSFRQCGIDVTNRSITLTKCYRSTKAIREFAERLIAGLDIKGMDGERATLAGGESLAQGEPPEERYFRGRDYGATSADIAKTIRAWQAKASKNFGDYAVLLRERRSKKSPNGKLWSVAAALDKLGIPTVMVTKDADLDLSDGKVKVMTMHRAKGLQFVGVVLVLDDWPTIPKELDKEDPDAVAENDRSERCLLYMAIMRAQRFVLLTSSNGHRALPGRA